MSQFKVFGPNIPDGSLEFWHYETLNEAMKFAEFIAGETGAQYQVFQLHGSFEREKPPVKFTPA